MTERNLDIFESKLSDPNTDLRTKCNFLIEIRDGMDHWCQGTTYPVFLQKFVPILLDILSGSPVFISTSPEQRLRNCALEILHRLPMSTPDVTDQYAPQIVDKLLELARIENEDNAVLCMKIIMEFERNHLNSCASKVQPFLDLILELFQTMDQTVKDTFDTPAAIGSSSAVAPGTPQYNSPRPASPVASTTSLTADVGSDQPQTRQLQKGTQSFKLVAECPIIVVSIFQAHRSMVAKNVEAFVHRIKAILSLQAGPQKRAHEEARERGVAFVGVAKDIKNRAAFGELVTAQVKTMSFLAYLLRVYQKLLADFLHELPEIVVRLLQDCPREKSSARKELLVAIRHIVNFNIRTIFLPKLDELLDERTLIGDGLTVYETLRPLAFTMLADLIHHVRENLKPAQIEKSIFVYTKNLHDNYPGTSFQTMSAKLLLNMAECMAKVEDKQDARYFLTLVLNAIAQKFASMNRQYHNAVKASAQYAETTMEAGAENYLADVNQKPEWDEIDIFNATPIKTNNLRDRGSDPVADNKFLFKNLLHGLKTLFYSLRASNPTRIRDEMDAANVPPNWQDVSYGFNAEEVNVLINLFHEGAQVFRYYNAEKTPTETPMMNPVEFLANNHMMSSGKEEKDLLETFATIFHHIDPATFHEVFQAEIPHLYEMIFDHPALLHIAQFLLASEATSPAFCGMMLQFLMGRLEEVGTSDVQKSSVLLRLFKLSFMAVTLFSAQNEQVLLPHVTKLITRSIELSVTAEDPTNYFLLLRSLFRSIGGGRFENLYKEILPLLEMLLEVLNNLLISARKPQDRDLFVELSLTVPARLSHLLPHLSYLMRPLVVALRAGSELIAQGLRTLELCVDNLTADYLDPIMAPVIDELMAALWDHLKPQPYSHFHAHTTMRILGKLGGRNRKFLTSPPALDYKPYADDEASYDIKLIGSMKDRAFPAALGIDVAIDKLREQPKAAAAKKSDAFHKQQALNLVKAQIKLLVGFDHLPDDFARLVRLQANDLFDKNYDVGYDHFSLSQRDKSVAKKDAQQATLLKLIKAAMLAAAVPELKQDVVPFLNGLYKHLTILELGRSLGQEKHTKRPFDPTSGEGPVFVDSKVIADAIADTLSSDSAEVRDVAFNALDTMWKSAAMIFGSEDRVERLPFFRDLTKSLIHHCFEEEWFSKSGGTAGINHIVNKLNFSAAWLKDRQIDLIRALFFVMKDMPQDLPANVRVQAKDVLKDIIRKCNEGTPSSDVGTANTTINNVSNKLVTEVSHMNRHVREAAQDGLRLLAEVVGVKLWEIVKPVKELVLQPIFNKPLRALPFSVQIGYIDALNFCLDMENEVLHFEDRLNRSLLETLALADAEDDTLAPKPMEHRSAESIVNLRVSCLRLLTTAIRLPAFNTSPHAQHRGRIITVFFKSLYSRNTEVKTTANAGLQIVLQATQKLPKDLLQSGLRPILMNVQDPRKLSVEGLEGLRTLLQLLTNYFKVEIGSRLLDHMKHIADVQSLQKVSFSLIEQNPKMRVVTAIFGVFHLLPAAAVQFLPTLVERVLELEHSLRRTHFSPFREPLIKYLNHYSKEALIDFSANLKDEAKGRFFAQILSDKAAAPLRAAVIESDAFWAPLTGEGLTDVEKDQAAVNAVHVALSLSEFPECRTWLTTHDKTRLALFEAAKCLQQKLQNKTLASSLRLPVEQVGGQLMIIITRYLAEKPDDLDFFFDLVQACANDELPESHRLFHFIYEFIITSTSVDYQRSVAVRCIDIYTNRQKTPRMKSFVFHNILNPIFAMDIQRNWESLFGNNKGTELFDKSMTDIVHAKLWKPQANSDISEDPTQPGVDQSRMELIQLTSMLLKYHHNMLSDARKDVIMFGWTYIRLEDTINKYASYALISYFIAHYDTPAKIVVQIYGKLLGAHQAEGRPLVMQALEILEPVLVKRTGGEQARAPAWTRIPRRILSEETSNTPQLTSIFQFLVRHPDLFYEARESFASIIIPSLNKVAQLPNPSTENKRLAINLFSMIWHWEERTVKENGSLSGPQSPDSEAPVANKKAASASYALRTMMIKYMVNFIAILPERFPVPSSTDEGKDAKEGKERTAPSSNETIRKSLELLWRFLSPGYWDDIDVDAMFPKVTEQILLSEPKQDEKMEAWTSRVINTLQMLRSLVNAKSDEWIVARLPQLQKLLAKSLKSESAEIQDCLHCNKSVDGFPELKPLMKAILDAVPLQQSEEDLPDAESPTDDFVNFLSTLAGDCMSATGKDTQAQTAGINVLWTLAQRKADSVDAHIPALLKALQGNLAKNHLAAQMPQPVATANGVAAQLPANPQEVDLNTVLIIRVIEMLSARIGALGEQRRPYLSVLASLVERSQNNMLCEKILSMVEEWVFNSTEPVPTLKEKTAVLQKMLMFENRSDLTLYHKFLDLVIRIYEDPKIFRSELAVRMEHAFLIGLRSPDIPMRTRFMTIYDRNLSRTAANRFFKLLAEQQWDVLADSFWLSQVIHLMFGSIDMNTSLKLHTDDFKCLAASKLYNTHSADPRLADLMLDSEFENFIAGHKRFVQELGEVKTRDVLEPLANLQHTDSNLAHDIWTAYFPLIWSSLSRDDREDMETGLINLLTKDFHQRQTDKRPNCVATLIDGIVRARPRVKFPPHVLKFQAKNYNAWYSAATYIEELAMKPIVDTPAIRESNLDALVELYATLQEDDLFYGTWRRRCQFVETNAALSYEQNGVWDKAQAMYEQAQIKARTGSIAFSQGEYMLWEDHWVYCAGKLQQWEILGDFAKHENLNDLFLEATWRNFDAWEEPENRTQLDTIIKAVSDAPTPRRMFFQAFMSLLKLHNKTETQQDFNRICDENIQLSIKNWHKLPKQITQAHIGLLQNFQNLVELHDASVICSSLAQTTSANLDVKSQELKLLLGTWRDRLPNFWDDINSWQDLVTWRQHIFQLINRTYLTLLPSTNQGNATGQSYAYRGYHETAWIINRFAHVARKHQMPDVCITQLSRIYTLPNIEIQEAFLKLREQAKCCYQNRNELTSGLDVINNTNLNYFGAQQKAEFYTLKGMFLAKLNHKEEANDAFGTALYFDIKLPKAWSEWGRYNDMLFKEKPEENMDKASAAISCYLEAAGQYKSAKSRKLLSRILWLLSLDDADNTLAKAFENFKGETPVWYWITFIPQLLNNLSRTPSEANIAHGILSKLAKTYPQALYFQLRTSREDMLVIKRSQEAKEAKERQQRARQSGGTPAEGVKAEMKPNEETASATPQPKFDGQDANQGTKVEEPAKPKKPWDHTEELTQTLKTAFPLLALSMETMVDQVQKYFKCTLDEDAYRLIVALLNDGLAYVGRYPTSYAQGVNLPPSTEANITRFAESILPAHIRKSFEADFVTKKPSMFEYIAKLRRWRDRFEEKLDRRMSKWHLEQTTHLAEFRFLKFDEVEVPGQYLQHRDKNQDFVRIERFLPDVELVRGVTGCHRRLTIRGHDGSVHSFAIQHPTARHSRREERVSQLFRIFNSTLAKKKESRRRNLQFHLPLMIPLSPGIRMVQDDASYISLQGIYEDYCRRNGINKDDPVLFQIDKLRALTPVSNPNGIATERDTDRWFQQKPEQAASIRLETFNAIQEKYVPNDVVQDYFQQTYPSYDSLWLFRRQFSSQLAALTFITFTMHMTMRYPHKMSISRGTGNIWGSELVPAMAAAKPYFHNPEAVPFRLTPNLQTLMGPIHTEGIFVAALMAIARCLTDSSSSPANSTPPAIPTPTNSTNGGNNQEESETNTSDLEGQLSIFIRDEMNFWSLQQHKQSIKDGELREHVHRNATGIVKKAVAMAKEPDAKNLPASQSVLDLVAKATEPKNLCTTDALWQAWL
ncbi:hypothetical protein D6C85_00283 [Aureobasidium pullulans]|uniref:Non-specific serine/threonine protein kinase n=1 Tax=Aureobasidium pullulans TaxID=5580 RepID=A0A4S9XKG9_AURPU|nr:hypothetical protein D6C85_00283 [Aureobasidium pullulans]